MVRLIGEIAGLPGGHAEKKRSFMDGVCKLVDGDCWVWGLHVRMVPGEVPVYTSVLHGGFSEDQFPHFMAALDHPDNAVFTESFAADLIQAQAHITRYRRQLDPRDTFPHSESYQLWQAAGIYPGILSSRPLDGNCMSTVAVYRRCDSPQFTERESRIVHILLTEVPWLHELGWPEDRGITVPYLAPRQRVALNLLLQGEGRKQIADHMGISINTVAGYVRDVYRHFEVQSHAELMRHFMTGDGYDVSA